MCAQDSAREIQVAWKVDDIDVQASLTRPGGEGPYPAVVMVAGSGPTDRNWNSPLIAGTNGSAALLAHSLAADGFMTLRYDKRGSGPQARENAQRLAGKVNLRSHVEELAGGVRLLAARQDVDPGRLFALTNSEGCIHALNYQLQATDLPWRGLVLTAPPGRPVGVLARSQVAAQLAAVPDGGAWLAAYDAAIEAFVAGRPVQVDENLPESMRALLLGLTNPLNQPFARELWSADAAALLAKVTAPVLIVIGKKDIQVDWQADGAIFEALAKDRDNITFVSPEDANHVLKYEPRPRAELTPAQAASSYSAEGTVLDPTTVETITAWLHDRL
jgi:pimeloyl-ACP methyl ester carboxylesterase